MAMEQAARPRTPKVKTKALPMCFPLHGRDGGGGRGDPRAGGSPGRVPLCSDRLNTGECIAPLNLACQEDQNMTTLTKLLDTAKEKCNAHTDMALAARLHVSRASVSNWRHGRNYPDATTSRRCMARGKAGNSPAPGWCRRRANGSGRTPSTAGCGGNRGCTATITSGRREQERQPERCRALRPQEPASGTDKR